MTFRFEFCIRDAHGNVVFEGSAPFFPTDISEFGAAETIDIHTGAALRFVRRQHIQGKYEPEEGDQEGPLPIFSADMSFVQ